MKYYQMTVFYCIGVLGLMYSGCTSSQHEQGGTIYTKTPGTLSVYLEHTDQFPEELAGTWQSDKDGWRFTFEPDGTISEAQISMGRTKIIPGKVMTVPTLAGGRNGIYKGNVIFKKGIAKPGLYEARFYFKESFLLEAAYDFVVDPNVADILPQIQFEHPDTKPISGKPHVRTDKRGYLPNEPIEVSFSGALGHAQDWVGIYKKGEPDEYPIEWFYTNGEKYGEAVYIPGDWIVRYDAKHRQLSIDLLMNYINIQMGANYMRGKTEDIIVGKVDDSGKTWDAAVYSIPEFESLPNDPNDLPYTRNVIFTKK